MFLSGQEEDFWEVSLWASEAHWEVVLSASEQLFRHLVSGRTVLLSSYQLRTPSDHLQSQLSLTLSRFLPLSFCSLTCFLEAFWRMWIEVLQEEDLMNALHTNTKPIITQCPPPHPPFNLWFFFSCSLFSLHFCFSVPVAKSKGLGVGGFMKTIGWGGGGGGGGNCRNSWSMEVIDWIELLTDWLHHLPPNILWVWIKSLDVETNLRTQMWPPNNQSHSVICLCKHPEFMQV